MKLCQLTPTQMEAIESCCNLKNRVAAVTGQAGTGKTVIMRIIADTLVANGYDVVLCAPTGKAAKRIKEATGYEAVTVHRLLEYPMPGELCQKTGKALEKTTPKRRRHNPLPYDVVLCDEYAMVAYEVHRNLFDAIKSGGCIRVFGDINQLKPIESNPLLAAKVSPFQDMLNRFTSIILDVVHRQAEGSGILANGTAIINKRLPRRYDDFKLHITAQPLHTLQDLIIDAEDDGVNYGDVSNQIITPAKKSWVGQHRINKEVQDLINPGIERHELPRNNWEKEPVFIGKGDKVIITKNNYDLEIFNGESGIVEEFTENDSVIINFGDKVIEVPAELSYTNKYKKEITYDPRVSIDLGFAVTTHKSQGSEYNNVIYMLNKSSRYNQNRGNFYTGITRARSMVHVISDQQSLVTSINIA